MMRASQAILYASSLAVIFILGSVLDTAFWQARFHTEHLLGGRPLPPICQFFISHHHLPVYLALLPWLGLVGAPLLRQSRASYWEPLSFVLRYLAFLSVELLLFLVFLLALTLPFLPYYAVLEPPRQSTIEVVVCVLFWLIATCIILLAVRRTIKLRNNRNANKRIQATDVSLMSDP